jgi:hypothetical protein
MKIMDGDSFTGHTAKNINSPIPFDRDLESGMVYSGVPDKTFHLLKNGKSYRWLRSLGSKIAM